MDKIATANTIPHRQAKMNWIAASAKFAAADRRIMALNGPADPSADESYAAGKEWSDAIHSLLQTRSPDAAALRDKLVLLLTLDDTDEALVFRREDAAAVLEDFDRITGTAPQPVNHEPAASRIHELALQAGHAHHAAMQALHDSGDAPEAALVLGALVSRLIGEIAEVAEAIERGESVEKAAPMLGSRTH